MNYSYQYTGKMDDDLISLIIYVVCTLMLGGGKGIITYIFRSLGVYGIAKRRGLKGPWMAWVPGCNIYAMGDLADHHNRVNESKSTRYSLRLLIWHIVSLLLTAPLVLVTLLLGVTIMVESSPKRGAIRSSASRAFFIKSQWSISKGSASQSAYHKSIIFLPPFCGRHDENHHCSRLPPGFPAR